MDGPKDRNTKVGGSIHWFLPNLLAADGGVVTIPTAVTPPLVSSFMDSNDLSAVPFWVTAVRSEIAVTVEDMAKANSATVATPAPVLVLFEGPVPGIFPGLCICHCLAFWAGVKLLYMSRG